MKVSGVHVDLAVKRKAQARMREIVSLLPQASGEDKDKLAAEFNEINGSWETIREFDIPDVLTEEEARLADIEAGKEAQRQAIRDELAANDLKNMRAVFEGDQKRVAEHNERQEALRVQLRAI